MSDEREIPYDDRPTRQEIEAAEAPTPGVRRRLAEDPWKPWTCPGCGTEDRNGMPQRCPDCGLVNFGG